MSTGQHQYVLSTAAPAAEVARLTQVEQYFGPITERHVRHLGVARGWHCLEVGAGLGAVARFLARCVGETGRVVATDLAPLFGPDPTMPQLEIRRHDVLTDGLETSAFDFVHCRLLLANVGDVERALDRLVGAVRPGGWLLIEEPGEGRMPAVGESTPAVAEYNALMGAFFDAVAESRTVDLPLYRRLPGLLAARGLTEMGGEHTQRLVDVAERAALRHTLLAMRAPLATTTFVTSGALDRLFALADDPALLTIGGSTLSLWGRRCASAAA